MSEMVPDEVFDGSSRMSDFSSTTLGIQMISGASPSIEFQKSPFQIKEVPRIASDQITMKKQKSARYESASQDFDAIEQSDQIVDSYHQPNPFIVNDARQDIRRKS